MLFTHLTSAIALLTAAVSASPQLEREHEKRYAQLAAGKHLDKRYEYKLVPTKLTQVQVTAVLKAHNDLRKTYGNVPALVWDDNLAQNAQAWANVCATAHDTNPDDAIAWMGQNLAWGGAMYPEVMVTDWWGGEEKSYNWNLSPAAWQSEAGHWIQIVWKKTTKVGCGITDCPGAPGYFVCAYNPGVNTWPSPAETVPLNVLPPTSK